MTSTLALVMQITLKTFFSFSLQLMYLAKSLYVLSFAVCLFVLRRVVFVCLVLAASVSFYFVLIPSL